MNRKAFTLIELLGVIVILGIVLGIAVICFMGVKKEINDMYYQSLEENIKLAGVDYYNYNKEQKPNSYGNIKTVDISELIQNSYIERILSKNGNPCSGYVGVYKTIDDQLNYFVCLNCDDYSTNNDQCN